MLKDFVTSKLNKSGVTSWRKTSLSPITITSHKAAGFTLVELAIVIVIIGLLVGGVLGGQALIRQSQVQNLIKTIEGYKSAAQLYKTKYNGLPGDDIRAYDWFGNSCDAMPSNCNGDGDGLIVENNSGTDSEALRFWQHLVLGKFLTGNYIGISNGWTTVLQGLTLPKLSFKDAYVSVENRNYALIPQGFGYNNYFISGVVKTGGVLRPNNPYLPPEDAYNVDKKMDDGKPWAGAVFITPSWSVTIVNCGITATSEYNLTYDGAACDLNFGW